MECSALIQRKTSELQALRRASSIYSHQSCSRIGHPTAFVPHTGLNGYNGTVPVNVSISSTSAEPIPAESLVKTNDVPHRIVRNHSETGRRGEGGHRNKAAAPKSESEVV